MQNRAMCHAWLPNSHPLPKGRRSVEDAAWPELSSSFSFTLVVAYGPPLLSQPSPPPSLTLYSVGKQTFLTFCKGWKTKNLWLLIRLHSIPHLNEKSESVQVWREGGVHERDVLKCEEAFWTEIKAKFWERERMWEVWHYLSSKSKVVCVYVSGANVSCDIKVARNTAVQSDPHPRSHRHTRMRLQEGDILHHCNSFKGNLQHSRAFWSLLISHAHPSHPSALPLTSLTNSLILCCKLFLHSILPEIKKTCLKKKAWAAWEKIIFQATSRTKV